MKVCFLNIFYINFVINAFNSEGSTGGPAAANGLKLKNYTKNVGSLCLTQICNTGFITCSPIKILCNKDKYFRTHWHTLVLNISLMCYAEKM